VRGGGPERLAAKNNKGANSEKKGFKRTIATKVTAKKGVKKFESPVLVSVGWGGEGIPRRGSTPAKIGARFKRKGSNPLLSYKPEAELQAKSRKNEAEPPRTAAGKK